MSHSTRTLVLSTWRCCTGQSPWPHRSHSLSFDCPHFATPSCSHPRICSGSGLGAGTCMQPTSPCQTNEPTQVCVCACHEPSFCCCFSTSRHSTLAPPTLAQPVLTHLLSPRHSRRPPCLQVLHAAEHAVEGQATRGEEGVPLDIVGSTRGCSTGKRSLLDRRSIASHNPLLSTTL